MTRYTLHVPAFYNDGSLVGDVVLHDIEARIIDIAGGFTRTSGMGGWRTDDGRVYLEQVYLYAVDSDDPEVPGKLHRLAERVADALRQEAVYLTHQAIGTSLVTPVTA